MDVVNVIIDISHHNGDVDLEKAKADGIAAVIHKATQGLRFADPNYDANRTQAEDAGLLWGAYHFGTGSDGVEQAEHFLQVVNPGPETLLVLDLEDNPQGPSMPLVEADAFVTHIHAQTGRWPGLYSGHYIKELLHNRRDDVLANCWFWLAQYGPTAVVPINWPTWTMWQYTDGGMGPAPHSVSGVGRCDRDKYNGTLKQLERFWKQ